VLEAVEASVVMPWSRKTFSPGLGERTIFQLKRQHQHVDCVVVNGQFSYTSTRDSLQRVGRRVVASVVCRNRHNVRENTLPPLFLFGLVGMMFMMLTTFSFPAL
jgi:hypothetical protein